MSKTFANHSKNRPWILGGTRFGVHKNQFIIICFNPIQSICIHASIYSSISHTKKSFISHQSVYTCELRQIIADNFKIKHLVEVHLLFVCWNLRWIGDCNNSFSIGGFINIIIIKIRLQDIKIIYLKYLIKWKKN